MKKLSIEKIHIRSNFEAEKDFQFFGRNYGDGDLSKYILRLKNIGFSGFEHVFDHGCGYGQWSFALAELNNNVFSYDIDESRILMAKKIKKIEKKLNINFSNKINYDDPKLLNKFDGIFSYGVLQCLDYKKMLNNYYRFLKPGGKLYFTGADLGWFIYCIIDTHNDTIDHSTREWGINAIKNSLQYESDGTFDSKHNVIMPYKKIQLILKSSGFKIIKIGQDGSTNFHSTKSECFFAFKKYGNIAFYEVLCEKI